MKTLQLKESKNVREASYDVETQRLYIVFSSGGKGYYEGVSSEGADAFENADSHGKYIHTYLKNLHPWVRL